MAARMLSMAHLTQQRLQELLVYQRDTGVFTNRVSRGPAKKGKISGCVKKKGYRYITVDGKSYRAHRLAWLYCYGEWPKDQIDHVDGDRQNNRIQNLRDVDDTGNRRNSKRQANNTTGVTGVQKRKHLRKWNARIKVDGRSIHLGYFNSLEEAAKARKEAERIHGFHENHGRVA